MNRKNLHGTASAIQSGTSLSRRGWLKRIAAGLPALGLLNPNIAFSLEPRAGAARKPLRIVVDADTANEFDDLFAIARALLEPDFRVEGITSAQWHTQEGAPRDTAGPSQRLNEELLRAMGRSDVPHPIGSNIPLVNPHRPQPSDAARHIIAKANETPGGEKLIVAVLGPCTNLASAVLMEPSIAPKVSCHFIGLRYDHRQRLWSRDEFNTNNDPNALDALLNNPEVEFHLMTATTSGNLVFKKDETDRHLKGKGGAADFLVRAWEEYGREWQRKANPAKERWTMWDVALIEAIAKPGLATAVTAQTPPENLQRSISVWVDIDAEGMRQDFWRAFAEHRSG